MTAIDWRAVWTALEDGHLPCSARRAVTEAEAGLAVVTNLLAAGLPTPNVVFEPLIAARRDLAHADQEITAAARAESARRIT